MKQLGSVVKAVRSRVADLGGEASRHERALSVRKAVAFNVRTRLLKRPTIAPIGQRSKIIAYPGETNSPLAAYHNPPNPSQMNVWRRHLKPGDLFIDIGANIGIYTIFALDLGAQVIACEPDLRNYRRILEHLDLNGYEAQVLNMAVADKSGTYRFTEGLDSLNHLLLDGSDDGIEVEATTLDTILGDRHAAGMKIDVEGAEEMVLMGGARALSERRIDMIQFEWAGLHIHGARTVVRSAPQILRDAGYSLYRADIKGALTQLTGHLEARSHMSGRDIFALSCKPDNRHASEIPAASRNS